MEPNWVDSCLIDSPVGRLLICSDGEAVTRVHFLDEGEIREPVSALLIQAVAELREYFVGQRKVFSFPFRQTGSDFQQDVWRLLQDIPYGKTISYTTLTRQYGDMKAIRAVASANGKNNLAIVVPCHRVIGSDGSLTGYAGGLWRKQKLLELEGVLATPNLLF